MIEQLPKAYVDAARNAAKVIAQERGMDLVHQVQCARLVTVCLDRGFSLIQSLNACDLFARQLTGETAIRPGETWGDYYRRLGQVYQNLDPQPIADDDIPTFLKIQAE